MRLICYYTALPFVIILFLLWLVLILPFVLLGSTYEWFDRQTNRLIRVRRRFHSWAKRL